MDSFVIKRGDTLPKLRHVVDPASTDLTEVSVIALMRTRNGESVALSGLAEVAIASGTPTLEYTWAPTDTALAGLYEMEFEVTFATGGVQTFPRVGYIQVKIEQDIPRAEVTAPPAAFTVDQWALADVPSAGGNMLGVTLLAVPAATASVFYSVNGGANVLLTSSPATNAQYMITVPAGASASIRLFAANAAGQSAASDAKAASPSVAVPAPFAAGQWILADSPSSGGTTLAITLSAIPATATAVRYSLNGGPVTLLTASPATSTPYNITVPALTLASVRIFATNAGGSSTASDTKTATPSAPETAPAAFTAGQWTLSDSPSAGADTLTINITALPSDGGSPITALQYSLNAGGAWSTLSGTGTGSRNITVLASTAASVILRAVNVVGNGPGSDTKTATPTAGGTFPALFASVNADGFSATYGSTPPTYDPENAPVFFTVTRQGFNATGGATTYSQNLIVTRREQQLPPNFASLSPDQVALSDYIYQGDTVLGVPTNISAEVSPKPVAQSIRTDRRNVGNTLPRQWLEVVAAHRDGIACVEWTISNAGGSVTVRSSNIMVSDFPGDKLKVLVYRPAADVDITSLTDDAAVNVNIKVYPRYGVAASVLDSSAQTNLWEFRDRVFHKRTAGLFYVYVGPTGNDGTGVISTNDMTARANPYLTFGAANLALRNRAAPNDNIDFCVMRIMEGTATTWANGTSSPRRKQNGASSEFVIEADPLAATTPTLTFATSAVSFHMEREDATLAGWCQARVRNLRIERTGNGVIQNNASTVRRLHLVWENIDWAFGANTNNLYNSDLLQVSTEGLTTNFTGSSTHWNISGTTIQHWLLRGVSSRAGIISGWSIHGCDFHNAGTMGVSCEYISGGISGSMITSSRFEDIHDTRGLVNFANATVVGWLFANNIVEYPFSNSVRLLRLSGDGNTGNTTHCLVWHNTLPGSSTNGSCNNFYDQTNPSVDAGYPAIVYRTHKLHSVVGNIFSQMAVKGAAFVNNALHNGNAAFVYGVGCRGNFFMDSGDNPATFRQQYRGRGSKNGPDAPPSLKPGFVTPGHVDDGVAGAGNGNYALTGGALAKAMVENSPWPFDVTGAARGTLASAGAYE